MKKYVLDLEPWLSHALKQIQELGLLQKYNGTFEIVEKDGKRKIIIVDDGVNVGLLDLLGAFKAGMKDD